MVKRTQALGVLALTLIPLYAAAGPCTDDLNQAAKAINERLDAIAARGKPAAQSTFATTHHQPTPSSIAKAEEGVGDIPAADVERVQNFMTEARQADRANDKPACEKALGGREEDPWDVEPGGPRDERLRAGCSDGVPMIPMR